MNSNVLCTLRLRSCAAALTASLLLTSAAQAQSVQAPVTDNSVAAELKSFEVAEGYEVNLFADETKGIANPVCFRWDPAGRLWVLCTWAYPQKKPVDAPDDRLIILEDTDRDGRADTSTVFADKLNMPTGFALGDGGAYVGQGSELLHVSDTDGDDRANRRQVIFSGFGTGDTHQNINSLTWSPGGELLFCQGLHSFARVETPWGIVRLDEHGVWRMRPKRRQLHSYRGGSGQNPWGITFGHWGEPFIKGNGTSLSELLPVMVYTDHMQQPIDIGNTDIKSMILEIVDSAHFPDDIQGNVLIAGYFAHVIDRLTLTTDGAGHRAEKLPPLLRSEHRSFRPVDISTGPDGAIYIADWYNPIIGHYQASFRHPDRDKTHGRIWRVVAKGRPLLDPPAVEKMSPAELCRQLQSDTRWVRQQAKRRLMDLPTPEVVAALTKWLDELDPTDPQLQHHQYEAIGIFESHEVLNRPLLAKLLSAGDYRARAYATRVVGRWHDRLEAPLKLLGRSIVDESSRVRLEAVVACSEIHEPEAMAVAARVTDLPMDRFIAPALSQCVFALAEEWLPALQAGTLRFEEPAHLIHVLKAHGGDNIAAQVRRLLERDTLSNAGRRQLFELLARIGNADDLRLAFDSAVSDRVLLTALVPIVESRNVQPAGDVGAALTQLSSSKQSDARAAAIRLAGLWKQRQLLKTVSKLVDSTEPDAVRAAALRSLVDLQGEAALERVRPFITGRQPQSMQLAALTAVSRTDLDAAAIDGLTLLSQSDDPDVVAPILGTLMQRRGATASIARALATVDVTADDAKLIGRWLSASGHDDAKLVAALKSAMGLSAGESTPYSEQLVLQLAQTVRKSGDARAGKQVFLSSLTNCSACHHVKGVGNPIEVFAKGPELTAVGAGLQLELIIESVIWPKRQIKEGYELTTLLLDSGRVVSGYVTAENKASVTIRDLTTGKVREYPHTTIEERLKKGTAMPAGFADTLTQTEIRDLAAYLASLKGASTGR